MTMDGFKALSLVACMDTPLRLTLKPSAHPHECQCTEKAAKAGKPSAALCIAASGIAGVPQRISGIWQSIAAVLLV